MSGKHIVRKFLALEKHGYSRLNCQSIHTATKLHGGRSAEKRDVLLGSRNCTSHDDSLSPPTAREIAQLVRDRQIVINIHGRVDIIDSLKLRDACSCKLCVDLSTTQKLFSTADIPNNIRARVDQVHADGSFSVSWTVDVPGFKDHISHYGPEFLPTRVDFSSILHRAHRENPRIPWSRDTLPKSQISFDFDRYVNDATTLRAVTKSLMHYGVAFISNVPPARQSVGSIASRIGPTMKTIYGETWDVRSAESPKNVADRDSDLTFHMDLLYYTEPPRLQLLHCLRQSRQGGESLFTDGLQAVTKLAIKGLDVMSEREQGWHSTVQALTKDYIPYHYKNNGQWRHSSHPTIVFEGPRIGGSWVQPMLNPEMLANAFRAVRWSPPFQEPLPLEAHGRRSGLDIGYWLAGAQMLQHEFQQREAIFQTKLSEGTCVIFDNWRVLHARKGFSGGERWLRGAYVAEAEFQKCMLELASQPFEQRNPISRNDLGTRMPKQFSGGKHPLPYDAPNIRGLQRAYTLEDLKASFASCKTRGIGRKH